MRRAHAAVVVALLPLLAATPRTAPRAMKELYSVRVTTTDSSTARFVIVSHGLTFRSSASPTGMPFSNLPIPDTLSTPTNLAVLGVGDAEIVRVGSGQALKAELRNALDGSAVGQTVTGNRLGLRHPKFGEPFETFVVKP